MQKKIITALALALTLTLAATQVVNSQVVNSQADTSLDAAIRVYTKSQGDEKIPAYKIARVDLNRDGIDDAIVLLSGSYWCGSGGCTMVVFKGVKKGFKLLSTTSVTSGPIRVLKQASSSWASLIVHSRNHGEALLRLKGKSYPDNSSTAPLASKAQIQTANVVMK